MKSKSVTKTIADKKTTDGEDVIAHYAEAQTAEHAAICHALRAEIDGAYIIATREIVDADHARQLAAQFRTA